MILVVKVRLTLEFESEICLLLYDSGMWNFFIPQFPHLRNENDSTNFPEL